MDPKVLLMPVYTRGNEIERLRGALALARFFNAHLDVVHAQPKPSDLLDGELFAMPAAIRERLVSLMDEGANTENAKLQAHFNDLCAQYDVSLSAEPAHGVASAHWQEIEGSRSELVALQGRVSDLIIVPHSKTGHATKTFEAAIAHSGRPVLLVPRGLWEFEPKTVVIGWDGGKEATKAVQQALPFLRRSEKVLIAANQTARQERPTADEAVAYLAHHGVAATIADLDDYSGSTGEALLHLAKAEDCTLLVTGSRSQTRLRQTVLGSVTGHLLQHADIPVLMAH